MSLTFPTIPLYIPRPSVSPLEHDKFKDNGKWFLDTARWLVLNTFNCYSIPTSDVVSSNSQTGNAPLTANGNSANGYSTRSLVDEMLQNYSYYNGEQDNRIFNFMTTGIGGTVLPNVFIKGQEIRSLADHIKGKCLELIEPIARNISADSISENALVKRQEVFDKIDLGAKIGDVLNELGGGNVQYNPAGEIDYSNPAEIAEAKKKIRSEYEVTGTVIARSAYFKNHMEQMFEASALDTIICNLAGMEFKEENGELCVNYIPAHNAIFDFSTWGQYGESQTVGGYIVPITYEDALKEYPNMNPAWKTEIQQVLYDNVEGAQAFMEYYNAPFQNVRWWYNDQKWMSKSVVYWIDTRDTRYLKKTNKFGGKKIQNIDDYKDYQIPTGKLDERGNMTFDRKKGYEIKGDSQVWAVHKAVVLGNKYLLEYGYDTYQVRPFNDKKKPELPVKFFCQGKIAGYVKSIVSRLKPKQDELDAVRYRIREYTANDLGVNIFINGAKLNESLTALNVVNDLKTAHVSVLTPTGDAGADASGMDDLVKVFSTNATAAIRDYLVLKADILQEMRQVVNLTDVALGEQTGVIGKGVQQETIARSELSGLGLYTSLQEYWRRCLQYAANKSKMIMLDQENKNVVLPLSPREVKLITLTKEFQYSDLMVYINENDSIAEQDMLLFKEMMQATAQNPTPEHTEAILNAMKIMKAKSYQEGIVLLEENLEKKKIELQKSITQQQLMQHQQEAYIQQSNQILQQQSEIAKLTTDLAKINAQGAWNIKNTEVKAGLDNNFNIDDATIAQITALVSAKLNPAPPQPQEQPQQ